MALVSYVYPYRSVLQHALKTKSYIVDYIQKAEGIVIYQAL
jgi:hypothetical protein